MLDGALEMSQFYDTETAMGRSDNGKEADMTYTVFANVEQQDISLVSRHRTLKAAGKAYQAAHTGNLRRVLDAKGNDVTSEATAAANGY